MPQIMTVDVSLPTVTLLLAVGLFGSIIRIQTPEFP